MTTESYGLKLHKLATKSKEEKKGEDVDFTTTNVSLDRIRVDLEDKVLAAESLDLDEAIDITQVPDDKKAWAEQLKGHLADFQKIVEGFKVPFKRTSISTLGGAHRASLMFTLSLDPKESWTNNILENSYYAKLRLGWDGRRWVLEAFSGPGAKKIRKYGTPDKAKMIKKLKALPKAMEAARPKSEDIDLEEGVKVDKQGSGDWVVYFETEKPKTLHRWHRKSKKEAIETAKEQQKKSGGYVSVMKGGIDVAEVGPGGKVKAEDTDLDEGKRKKSMEPGGGGRFAKLKARLAKRGDVEDPAAVAAAIGRKKWGKERFQKMAAKGRARASGD